MQNSGNSLGRWGEYGGYHHTISNNTLTASGVSAERSFPITRYYISSEIMVYLTSDNL